MNRFRRADQDRPHRASQPLRKTDRNRVKAVADFADVDSVSRNRVKQTRPIKVRLQARVVSGMLAHAKRLGFSAALAWRLEDKQAHDIRFSFYDGDRPRPALNVMRAAAGLPALSPSATPTPGIVGALGTTP